MRTKLLISVILYSSDMLSQAEYVGEVLQSKKSQGLWEFKVRVLALLSYKNLIKNDCDKEALFSSLNLQAYSTLKF